jgi:hypothetical protein
LASQRGRLCTARQQAHCRRGVSVWKLAVDLDKETGPLTCEDGNGNAVYRKAIEKTDFPLKEISLYFRNKTILLPSEY